MVVPHDQRPVVPRRRPPPAPAPPPENPWVVFVRRYGNDPVLFVREVLGADPFPDQIELLEAYQRGDRRISKRSGHGVGKTTGLAWIIVHHAIFRFPQKTVCTAPTSTQLFDALYSETVSWFRKLKPQVLELFEIKSENIELKRAPTESFVSFVTSSAEKPEALAGKHSANVLLIIDEASGVPEAIFEASIGSMSGHNATTILCGNPVRTSGLFYDTHNKPEVMADWTRFHTSCEGHPNVTPDFMAQVAAQYGEGSNAYRVRVLGEFPLAEANTVIPFELAESALKRDVKPVQTGAVWGLDVGLSMDPSCLCKRRGNSLDEPTEEFRADDDLMRVVAWVKGHWDATPISRRPSEINTDAIGIGAGVAHRLRELNIPAYAINVSESAGMSQGFPRLRDELWWKAREWLAKRDCSLAGDKKLAQELVRPTYKPTPAGKIQIESKSDTKKRTKTRSPNRADSFILSLASDAVVAAGLTAGGSNWKEPVRREIKGLV